MSPTSTQEEDLEKLYSPSQWSKRGTPQQVIDDFYNCINFSGNAGDSDKLIVLKDIKYGSRQATLLDIYKLKDVRQDKLFVFIHGGYWQEGGKKDYGFLSKLCSTLGVTLIVPGYDLTPNVSLAEIVKEMGELSKFLQNYTSDNNIREMWVCGHSAGAHLCLSLLDAFESKDLVTGLILVSGVYDLVPLLPTSNNIKLALKLEEAENLSPIKWMDPNGCLQSKIKGVSLLVAAGMDESPAFIAQSKQFVQKAESAGAKCEFMMVPGCDHFNIITDLIKDDFSLTAAIMNLISTNSLSD